MDFGNAAILIASVFGLTEFVKRFLGPKLSANSRINAAAAIVVGQAAVWLVGTTAWAHEQVIGTKVLDELNSGSKVLVGLFAAGVAAGINQVLGAIKNVGYNYPGKVVRPPVPSDVVALPPTHPNSMPEFTGKDVVDPSTIKFGQPDG
jgi:hypothetical protein